MRPQSDDQSRCPYGPIAAVAYVHPNLPDYLYPHHSRGFLRGSIK